MRSMKILLYLIKQQSNIKQLMCWIQGRQWWRLWPRTRMTRPMEAALGSFTASWTERDSLLLTDKPVSTSICSLHNHFWWIGAFLIMSKAFCMLSTNWILLLIGTFACKHHGVKFCTMSSSHFQKLFSCWLLVFCHSSELATDFKPSDSSHSSRNRFLVLVSFFIDCSII